MTWENEMIGELLEEVELSGMDTFLEDSGISMTFYELLEKIIDQGWGVDSITELVFWIKDLLFSEISANKMLFLI